MAALARASRCFDLMAISRPASIDCNIIGARRPVCRLAQPQRVSRRLCACFAHSPEADGFELALAASDRLGSLDEVLHWNEWLVQAAAALIRLPAQQLLSHAAADPTKQIALS